MTIKIINKLEDLKPDQTTVTYDSDSLDGTCYITCDNCNILTNTSFDHCPNCHKEIVYCSWHSW